MPPNKYRGVTVPLIFMLIFPFLLALYGLALFISLAAFSLGACTYCCCGNSCMNGMLAIADSLVEASNRIIEVSIINGTNQDQQLPIRSSDALRRTNQPGYGQTQNQHSIVAPSVEMPINQHNNMVYQHRHLQEQVDSPPSVNTIAYPKTRFTYAELLEATNRFSGENFLGEGGFGIVHKGILPDGREVAMKQLKSDNKRGQHEFKAEIDVLSRVHHRHLAQYFGCCITQDKRMIVCEYMPNKTVEYHLHSKPEGTIDWSTRLKISIGAAKGLAYLHEECQPRIIHRDIKAANILLDPSFEAKVADFGLAKIFPDGISRVVATNLMGTHGYLAPELSRGEIREKSDTFSFGVVLLELITGKKPIITRPVLSEDSFPFESLTNWARSMLREALQNGNYDYLVDLRLCNLYNYDEMKRMISCAAACIQKSPQGRPLMSKVVLVLAGQASPDDLYIGSESTEIPIASTSSTYEESSDCSEQGLNITGVFLPSPTTIVVYFFSRHAFTPALP